MDGHDDKGLLESSPPAATPNEARLRWNTTGKATLYLPYNVKYKCCAIDGQRVEHIGYVKTQKNNPSDVATRINTNIKLIL